MATIEEWAKSYEAKKLRNIAELPSCSIDLELKHDTIGEGDDEREYQYIEVNGEKYEVKKSVFQQLRTLLEVNPTMKSFKVIKTGEGMKTRYSVLPLAN
jgi:hypothetical protein